MGKAKQPAVPDYKGQAVATGNSGKYSEDTPYGSVDWSLREGADPNNPQAGDYTRTTTLSPEQQQLYQQGIANQLLAGSAGQQQLNDLSGGSQRISDAMYRRATQYYDQNFGDQQQALRTQLLNGGLQEGTEAYDKAMRNFGQQRNTAYADAADRAVLAGEQGQNNAVSRLAQILAMSRGQTPTSGNSAGGAPIDFSSASQNAYNAQVGSVNAQNAQSAANTKALMDNGLMALMLMG